MVSVTLINFQLHVFHFLIRILIIREHKKKTKKHRIDLDRFLPKKKFLFNPSIFFLIKQILLIVYEDLLTSKSILEIVLAIFLFISVSNWIFFDHQIYLYIYIHVFLIKTIIFIFFSVKSSITLEMSVYFCLLVKIAYKVTAQE